MKNGKPSIPILILAAGESKRMGERVKQLLPWKNTTLLENALAQARASQVEEVFVVLGANDEFIKKQTQLPDDICIYNENWSNGMGSSIVAGLKHLLSLPVEYDGMLVMLADQPLIDAAYIDQVIDTWGKARATITATGYENGLGVPAMFDKCHFTELLKLTKDYGARHIINDSNIKIINPQGKEMDIDTWQDYQNMIQQLN
ncbi:MAG: molybdenum cofactor cytidylyltransferase [Maribacter sp.]|uniref:nucleotidyltransferase family protein n=1 Tax=Maribacter sp. 2307UL18-2 TaxID=3386274 RepID=UPI0039BCFC4C